MSMDKVVILARVSTQAQDYQRQVTELQEYCDRAGWEVTRVFKSQRECCDEYAKQHGYTIVKYCGGKHESAKTPGAMVKEMNEYVKKHKEVGTILVSEFDRFSRT